MHIRNTWAALAIITILLIGLMGCGGGGSANTGDSGGTSDNGTTDNSGGSPPTYDTTGTAQAGLSYYDADSSLWGYTLFAPITSTTTYLIDNYGAVVNSWQTGYQPGNVVYLLENGNLLHTGNMSNSSFGTGGAGGNVALYSWEGTLLWEFTYSSTNYLSHHDVEYMPNGNILMIAWEKMSYSEAVAAGRDPSLLTEGEIWPETIIEVDPSGNIVWKWNSADHFVQDYDSSRSNYGSVSSNPQLIDINYVDGRAVADLMHINSVDYNPSLDQILLSVHTYNEIWIIDHSTTTEEAAGHFGGNSGKGGDLLYRWGNPEVYGSGSASDRKLYLQHDAHWITDGLQGVGNILIYNNGDQRSGRAYSTVDELYVPGSSSGSYTYGSGSIVWTYSSNPSSDFFSQNISGAERLSNGNTLICEGASGHIFEVTNSGELVWDYTNPGGTRNSVFRAYRYEPSYPAFSGKTLSGNRGVGQ